MQRKRNITERAGRWSAQHRKKAIFGWLAFVVVALVLGGALGTNTLTNGNEGTGDSGKADRALADGFPEKAGESVLVQSKSLDASDPKFKAAVADVSKRLQGVEGVAALESPYKQGNESQVSKDGRSTLVTFDLQGDDDKTEKTVDHSLAAVAAAQRANPDLRIEEFGDASADKAISKNFEDDFKKAEFTSLPMTLIILVLAFGSLVAAGVPLLLAISAVAATIGLLGPISQMLPVSESIASVVLLIGLAVGVDYALFYLRREREERAAGNTEEASLIAAAATSGRAVLISGITVIIAMAGMYIAGDPTFNSFATGTILVVTVAMIGSLTVLPAVLSKLGDRVEKGRVPGIARLKGRMAKADIWSRIVDRVLRRPGITAAVSAGLLVALALPTLGMNTAIPGLDSLPRSIPEMQTYDRIQAAFPGENIPAEVVVQAKDVTTGPAAAAIADLQDRAAQQKDLFKPGSTVEINPDKTVADIDIPIAGDGTDGKSHEALDALRDDLVPATVGGVEGAKANVTGITAGTADFNSTMNSSLPYVFAFVLGAAFLLLMVMFRSIVIPAKAIVLNLLSVGAAYGVLVLVFQHGWGQSLLGFDVDRGGYRLAPVVPVRGPVRAVDGLPRVHPHPDPRGRRQRHADRRGRGEWHQVHRRRGHQRGDRDGRGVRDLRHLELDRVQADGCWPGRRDPDRRDDHPGVAAPGHDEAPR